MPVERHLPLPTEATACLAIKSVGKKRRQKESIPAISSSPRRSWFSAHSHWRRRASGRKSVPGRYCRKQSPGNGVGIRRAIGRRSKSNMRVCSNISTTSKLRWNAVCLPGWWESRSPPLLESFLIRSDVAKHLMVVDNQMDLLSITYGSHSSCFCFLKRPRRSARWQDPPHLSIAVCDRTAICDLGQLFLHLDIFSKTKNCPVDLPT